MEIVKVSLPLNRVTKNKVLYQGPQNSESAVENVYVKKSAFKNGSYPNEVEVTISIPDKA